MVAVILVVFLKVIEFYVASEKVNLSGNVFSTALIYIYATKDCDNTEYFKYLSPISLSL